MKKLALAIFVMFYSSCYELNHTQSGPPELDFDKLIAPADGSSEISITITTKNELTGTQALILTASAGELFSLPVTSLATGSSSLTLYPASRQTVVILKAPLLPNDEVLISAGINGLISQGILKFERACPTEMQVTNNRSTLSITNEDTGQIAFLLIGNEGAKVSQDTEINLSTDVDSVAEIPNSVLSDSNGMATAVIKPLKAGVVHITVTLRSCPLDTLLSKPKLITYKVTP